MGGCTLLLQSWAWYRMSFIEARVERQPPYPLANRKIKNSNSKKDDFSLMYLTLTYHATHAVMSLATSQDLATCVTRDLNPLFFLFIY